MAALQQLKALEMPRRVETLLNTLQDFLLHPPSDWLKDTEDLFVPSLPAVSLQWTYRDGRLVNLPVSLLVEGDIISLRPGSEAPTELRGIQPHPSNSGCFVQEEEHVILSQSDVFSHLSSPPSPLDQERSRPHRLLQPKLFRVTRTPAVELVQRCLELSQHRPVSVLDNERFTVQTLLERGPAPLALPHPFCGLEMLSLSLDRARFDDTRVQFDDMQWERYAPSLRPLGLAIQLLLGNATVATRVLRLSDHLTHAALLRTRPPCQPVRPPWGLCQLPKLLGEFQLFSYGSADAVLSTCLEFWNGEDLEILTDSDRKKVVDFYQRSCMAGQCVAVSFKPLLQPHDPEIDGMCVELPPSLSNEDAEDVFLSPLKQQVFLGLVSSQYQVRPDMVRLISGLDSACIRFVYFSNEEEVRSKVFAEKMGLETGWNCHISLQSECFPLDPENIHLTEREEEESQLMGECVREEAESRSMEHESTCLIEDLNRAKLPKGIENVRPHLENIDNVPLLVPLFTDCTSQTECEMVCIMQEYGEVVCCLGSSQNINNNPIFLQSDISIALEPLVPICCPSSSHTHPRTRSTASGVSLGQLSSAICGLACTVQLHRQDNNVVIRLIRQARHTTAGIRKCFLFLLQCQLSLVLIQILACMCQLPPPLATSDVLLLSCCYYPLLSVSLLGKPSDSSIMKVPTGKNLRFLPKKTLRFFVLCFSVKFGLTVCIYLTCFGLLLHAFCLDINHEDEKLCYPAALLTNSTVWSPDWFGKHADGLSLGQKVISSLTLLYAMCTSVSHVHRSAPLWKQNPLSNQSWCAVICTLPILSVSIATGSRLLWHDPAPHHTFYISDVPLVTWLLGVLWLFPLIFINEGIKLHEIRMRVRYQKRQKLQFDTKLGMNSPF
ncbi:hypothetical protein KOW79_020442 [Hemibagrus wyckioides]|uniref:Transmembrane protein 94 n=1 Tax=Hemibagrus wyckioides TaxID=337641 RepID=A0A9D3S8U3_9TELE|nr:hypothetical protein KOW79_020442 [Hemibagrus wyckioides]